MNTSFQQTPDTSRGMSSGQALMVAVFVVLTVGAFAALFTPPTRSRTAAARSECQNHLKQIGLALHNYHDTYDSFPPAYTVDADGNRLHSWRTLLLPFLDEQPLYDKIDLSKPWDDPANAEVFAETPVVYLCYSVEIPPRHTVYQGNVSVNGFFRPEGRRTKPRIVDQQKLAVIEVDVTRTVHWMSPNDAGAEFLLSLAPETKTNHKDGTHILQIDGAVMFVESDTPQPVRRSMLEVMERIEPLEETRPEP